MVQVLKLTLALDTYVSQKKSRLIEPEFARQDDNSQNWYRIPKELATKQQISAEIAGMDAAFKAAVRAHSTRCLTGEFSLATAAQRALLKILIMGRR